MTGLWSRFDPAQLASEEGFRADPQRVWDWYAERRDRRARGAAERRPPARWPRSRSATPGVLTVVTQNVDDLHQRAGNAGADPAARRHPGRPLARGRAALRCGRAPTSALAGRPPRCADCGNLVRPGVVWFGETCCRRRCAGRRAAARACDVMLVVGTSGAVWPAAGLAAPGAARRRLGGDRQPERQRDRRRRRPARGRHCGPAAAAAAGEAD